jgi:hypothetical protein
MCQAGGVAQVVECLLSKREALSSNPTITRKKKDSNLSNNVGVLIVTNHRNVTQWHGA